MNEGTNGWIVVGTQSDKDDSSSGNNVFHSYPQHQRECFSCSYSQCQLNGELWSDDNCDNDNMGQSYLANNSLEYYCYKPN